MAKEEGSSTAPRPLILGYAPRVEGRAPLDGPAGRRLARMSGMSLPTLFEHFTCANLLPLPVETPLALVLAPPAARAAGEAWRRVLAGTPTRPVVLLGRRVEAAVLGRRHEWFVWTTEAGFPAVVVPHPSRLNRCYNSPVTRRMLSRTLLAATSLARRGE